jgi:choloylglycine hydrolase
MHASSYRGDRIPLHRSVALPRPYLVGQLAALVAAVLLACLPTPSRACSTFCLRHEGRIVFGKNYDWDVSEGMLVVNKRNVAKASTSVANAAATPALRWTSRHGSVTFNQYGREFPNGGINEAGLVIELMWLNDTRYPDSDARPALGCLQWIQYQLDTAAMVREVLASDGKVRISSSAAVHYLVADRHGDVAAVEFLDGRLVAHTGEKLPVAALTNSTYAGSLAYLERLRAEGTPPPTGYASVDRFARAAERLERFSSLLADGGSAQRAGTQANPARPARSAPGLPAPDAVAYAFETLADLDQGSRTQWSIVYELDRLRLTFRTHRNPRTRELALADLEFDCSSPVLVTDLSSGPAGDVAGHLVPYNAAANLELVRTSTQKTEFLTGTSEAAIRERASFPESTSCRD